VTLNLTSNMRDTRGPGGFDATQQLLQDHVRQNQRPQSNLRLKKKTMPPSMPQAQNQKNPELDSRVRIRTKGAPQQPRKSILQDAHQNTAENYYQNIQYAVTQNNTA
jgi:hypothetical protein